MSIETHRVVMGACGWKHPAWLEDFYSDDLPEDWQLGFYSNEFSLVYVPASDWGEENLAEIDFAEWLDDISDSFRFILEMPINSLNDDECFNTLLSKAKVLGKFCLGLVFPLNQNICADTQLFQSRLDTAQAIAPVCVDKAGMILPDDFKTLLLKNNISEVWNGRLNDNAEKNSAASLGLMRGGLAITHISGEELDMATLRKIIEVCLQASTEDSISVLCLDGNPPSLEILRNADIILNLL